MRPEVLPLGSGSASEPQIREQSEELARVLHSKYFARARKKSRFLEYVCAQTLAGCADQVTEYVIGMEVYERGPQFDPQEDAIVRVQAWEVRKALKDYYASEGLQSPLHISLPLGGYVPVWLPADAPETPVAQDTVAPEPPPPQVPSRTARKVFGRFSLTWKLALAGCLLLIGGLSFWLLAESHWRISAVPSLPPEADWFWGPLIHANEPPLVVLSNHPVLALTHDGDSAAIRARSIPIDKARLPELAATPHYREFAQFRFKPTTAEFTSMGEAKGMLSLIQLFAAQRRGVRVQEARLVDFATIETNNTILLGGSQEWSGHVFRNSGGFELRDGIIMNKSPRPGEQSVYRPQYDPVTGALTRDYGIVLMLPNAHSAQRILLLYGIYGDGSQAAIEYVCNPERLTELRRKLTALTPARQSPPSYFEALLETDVENGVPGRTRFECARLVQR